VVPEEKLGGRQTITSSNQMTLVFQIKVQNLARISMEFGIPAGRCN